MANPLLLLLQQAGIIPQAEPSPDIVVNAAKTAPAKGLGPLLGPPAEEPNAAPIALGNRDYIEEGIQSRKNSSTNSEGKPQHTGMFGTKGTLRDILGMVGDAFLVNSGNKQVYAPKREQENIADALAGFSQEADPRAAIERLASLPGGAEMAQQLYQQTLDTQIKDRQIQATEAGRQTTANTAKAGIIDKFTTRFGNMLNGAKTPEQREAVLRLAAKQAAALNIDPQEIGIPEGTLTPEEQQAFVSGATTINQQNTLPIAQQRADAATRNSLKQPAPRAAPQPTAASVAYPLLKKVQAGQTLTPGEQETLVRTGFAPNRGQGRTNRLPPSALPPGLDPKRLKKIN